MFPGGMEVGDEELQALERVIRSKNLFRYYGVGDGPQEVDSFERELAEHMGAAHALAVGLDRLVTLDHGLTAALREARAAGAATIAAHPHSDEQDAVPGRTTRRFSREPDRLRPLIDRYEQYAERPPEGPLVVVAVERWSGWSAS